MKGILNRGINKIELVNNIRENGEGIEINKNYINKLKKEVSYEEALMFLCISTVETYGLEKEIERLNNIIEKIRDYVYKPIDKEWGDILCIIEDGLIGSDYND